MTLEFYLGVFVGLCSGLLVGSRWTSYVLKGRFVGWFVSLPDDVTADLHARAMRLQESDGDAVRPPPTLLDALFDEHRSSPIARAVIGAERDVQRAFDALETVCKAHDTTKQQRFVTAVQIRARGQLLSAKRSLRGLLWHAAHPADEGTT